MQRSKYSTKSSLSSTHNDNITVILRILAEICDSPKLVMRNRARDVTCVTHRHTDRTNVKVLSAGSHFFRDFFTLSESLSSLKEFAMLMWYKQMPNIFVKFVHPDGIKVVENKQLQVSEPKAMS